MNVNLVNEDGALYPTPGVTRADIALDSDDVKQLVTPDTHTKRVLVQVDTANVRITYDGSTPTASHGHQYAAGDILRLSVPMATALKARRESGSANLLVTELTF
jgi:hypothetical protein